MAPLTTRKFDEAMTPRERELAFGAGTYMKRDITLVRGEGIYAFDNSGRKYIDCISGIAVAALGHAHPELVKAISEQAGAIMSAPELLCNPVRAEYQRRLLEYFPESYTRVFLCNSGAESIEGALKFARFTTGKFGIAALKKGFHGKTMGALSPTAEPKYREPFQPLLPEVHHVSPDVASVEELLKDHGDKLGCFIFEPLQGEGGINVQDETFVKEAIALFQARGILVICDEVQSGFGRTGRMWAHEHFNIQPDIVCLAKAIGGGVPMGAIVIGEKIAELPPQSHTSTFGGNPLASRAGLCVLDVIERDKLVENARNIGEHLASRIRDADLKTVREVRGKGLMIGIELKQRAGQYIQLCADRGLLILLAGTRVIRLLPPLIISREQADEIADILIDVLSA
ncbi:MAG: aminotransferase class III-fold pyridoxal phosphate-dependent enzyme [Bdellovibrionales bacterium]|nr:aminotransferase class III-fold pyridoxal phosphate-dependent enzyme [Bdellovibrionales bacterium]